MGSVTLSFSASGSRRETQPLCLHVHLKAGPLWCGPIFWCSSQLQDLYSTCPDSTSMASVLLLPPGDSAFPISKMGPLPP